MIFFASLRTKLFILFSFTFFIIISLNFYININNSKDRIYNYFTSSNDTIMQLLSTHLHGYIHTKDYDQIKKFINSIDSLYLKNIYILDSKGHSILEKTATLQTPTPYPFYNALLNAKGHKFINNEHHLIMKTFDFLDTTLGYIVVEGDLYQYNQNITKESDSVLLSTLLFILISIISAYLISRSISKPLENIIFKLQKTDPNEKLIFNKQPQEEYQYLSDAITAKHNALQKLNIHLEDKVTQKTFELQNLNAFLEEKIEEAVTNLQQKEELFQRQSRHAQMGEMIAMIAHQWRQPLSAISATTFSILVKSKRKKFDFSTEKAQMAHITYLEKNLEKIEEYVQFLSQTIDDFRNFFKQEKLKEECSINDIVKKALQIIEEPLRNYNIEIKTELTSLKSTKLFKNEMTQVILNILKNAEDHFLENHISGSEISIYTYDCDKGIILEISDNGGGIDPHNIDKIFDPYFSTKKEKNGTGLGLYMSKVIIESHNNGILEVENRDKGATFIITFNL
ncbi:MAG: HAMP domain-containing sensor histidine kinase [Campylobacterota bacterium]|nr:HAMP domain-containing sensor histidine kinase [Campylobacterota bacterium]